MFYTVIKKFHSQNTAQTWQQTLQNREVLKNSYRVHGDVKKAKTFVQSIKTYSPHTHFIEHGEHIIFSSDMPIAPAYAM